MNQKRRKKGMKYVLLLAGILLLLSSSAESQAAARKPSLSKKKLHMTVGKQECLSVKNKQGYVVSWKSNKKAVATVSKTGKIKAKKSGSARITAIAKPSQDGKSYRLVCQVSVKNKKGKKADSGNSSGQQGNSPLGSGGNPSPAVSPEVGSATQDPATSGQVPGLATPNPAVSDPAMPTPIVSHQPMLNPATPTPPASAQPLPNPPAGSTTGSAIADGKAKLLFGNYNDGLLDGDFFGNQVIDSYEQLQSLIHETKEEMRNVTWQGGCDRLQWYINQLETIGQDYFIGHVLCINTMMVARGYDYTLDCAEAVVEEDGTKTLRLWLWRHYNLKDGECVTDDMPYYSFFIQLPRELVQGCESVVCSLVSGGAVVPSGNPEHPYMMQDVLRILDQVRYPIS